MKNKMKTQKATFFICEFIFDQFLHIGTNLKATKAEPFHCYCPGIKGTVFFKTMLIK